MLKSVNYIYLLEEWICCLMQLVGIGGVLCTVGDLDYIIRMNTIYIYIYIYIHLIY